MGVRDCVRQSCPPDTNFTAFRMFFQLYCGEFGQVDWVRCLRTDWK